MTTTTQSPVQDITTAETEAKKKLEEAKSLAAQEVEAYKKEEQARLEKTKESRKEEATKELAAEKESLGVIFKEGKEKTKGEVKKLREGVEGKKAGIVSELVDRFISFFTTP